MQELQKNNAEAIDAPVSYGIKETTDAVVLGCRIGNAVERTMADGKVTIGDTKNFFDVVPAIKPALEGGKFIGRELADLDDDERETLRNRVAEELDLSHDDAEEIIEDCFDLTLRIIVVAEKIKALRRPTPKLETV